MKEGGYIFFFLILGRLNPETRIFRQKFCCWATTRELSFFLFSCHPEHQKTHLAHNGCIIRAVCPIEVCIYFSHFYLFLTSSLKSNNQKLHFMHKEWSSIFCFIFPHFLMGAIINSGKDVNNWTPDDTWDLETQMINMINVYTLCTCIKFIRKSIALYRKIY